jgi:putative aldouronate transport system permease protein
MARPTALERARRILIDRHEWQLYLFILPVVLYFVILHYIPMYGIVIAFKRYSVSRGILESPWVGFLYFEKFFGSAMFGQLMWNSIYLSFYQLLAFFPFPLALALMLNYTNSARFKGFAQTVTYAPHFISIVVLAGMMFLFGSPTTGLVNVLLDRLGAERVNFMGSNAWFPHIFVGSQVWQNTGYQAIIFLAALTAVDVSLYEAATIDGATKMQKILYIDLPAIMPTTVTLLLLQVGRMLNVDTQKVLLMQTALNLDASEIFGTYVYKVGLIGGQFSYSTAINLFQNVVNLALLVSVNAMSRRLTSESLW